MTRPIRYSELKNMSRSPAHFQYALENERPDTTSLRLGRLVDKLLLGPSSPCIFDGTRRGKAWQEFQTAHQGEEIFTRSELEDAEPMAISLQRHPEALKLLTDGRRGLEISFKWLGRDCVGHPDVVAPNGDIADLKTTRDGRPERFQRDIFWYYYHAQLAWYRMGLGNLDAVCRLVTIESSPPYPVTIYRLTPRSLEAGEKSLRMWMERLLNCEVSNAWPAYSQTEILVDLADETSLVWTADVEEGKG